MEALFTAVDMTGVATNVTALLVGFIGIGLIFFGRRILKRIGVSL